MHTEKYFSESCKFKPNLICNFFIPIDLAPNGIHSVPVMWEKCNYNPNLISINNKVNAKISESKILTFPDRMNPEQDSEKNSLCQQFFYFEN